MLIILIAVIGFIILKGTNTMTTQKPQQGTQNNITATNTDTNFLKALKVVLNLEGGYTVDSGGPTMRGITQNTYNAWLSAHGQQSKPVKNISDSEVQAIYYNNYWKAVGADKTNSYPLALLMFDTAVNHGVSVAKSLAIQSNYNIPKYLELRMQRYKNDRNWKIYGQGWTNRIAYIKRNIGLA